MDVAAVMAEGFAAIARRLKEHSTVTEGVRMATIRECARIAENHTPYFLSTPIAAAIRAMAASPAPSPEPPTGIARQAYGVNVSFVAECLRSYATILRDGKIDGAGHYFPADIEEAADMLEAGEIELLQAAEDLIGSLVQTSEHDQAMRRLRATVGRATD
jgi:hypothetical protein